MLPLAVRRALPRFVFRPLARLNGSMGEVEAFLRDHQLGLFETLERVKSGRLSMARLGDGELALALDPSTAISFHHGSPELQAELRAILRGQEADESRLLVCVPGITVAYYRAYWAKYWPALKPLLDRTRTYGNTSVTREALFRLDPEAARRAWRSVWDGRDVCFITGQGSRFQYDDELFGGLASRRTLYSLPRDAYSDVPRLIGEITASVPRETMILIALGPAATILAARLARLGYWALDIGHLPNAYRTVARGAPPADALPVVSGDGARPPPKR
jgi:hypothetical protein